jgi:hypothetical protein
MGWPALYENGDGCRLAIGEFFDDFHKLKLNVTSTEYQMDIIFNVTAIISGSYAKTIYECYNMERQIQAGFVIQEESFVDENDKYTSFLFNLLAESIAIREYSYDLIDFSEQNEYVSYTQSFAGIISSMIYFDSSTAASLLANEDPFSPYYEDKYGKLHKKEDVHQFIQDYNQTYYRDIYFAASRVAKG